MRPAASAPAIVDVGSSAVPAVVAVGSGGGDARALEDFPQHLGLGARVAAGENRRDEADDEQEARAPSTGWLVDACVAPPKRATTSRPSSRGCEDSLMPSRRLPTTDRGRSSSQRRSARLLSERHGEARRSSHERSEQIEYLRRWSLSSGPDSRQTSDHVRRPRNEEVPRSGEWVDRGVGRAVDDCVGRLVRHGAVLEAQVALLSYAAHSTASWRAITARSSANRPSGRASITAA